MQSPRDAIRITLSATKPSITNNVFHKLGGEDPPLHILSPDVDVWALSISDESSLIVSEINHPLDFIFEVSKGNVTGHSVFNCLGERSDIGYTACGKVRQQLFQHHQRQGIK